MRLQRIALGGIKWTFISSLGRSVFQLVQIAVLTRFLPKEAFGLVAMALFVVQFTTIFVDMGMTSAILHRQNATQNEYSSIYWFSVFISLLLFFFIWVITPLVSAFYNEPELQILLPMLGVNLVLMAIGQQHRTILQKNFKFKIIATTELISFSFGLITASFFAIKGHGVYSLVYSTLIASVISNSLFLILNLRKNPISFYFRMKDIKPFFRIGGYTMGSTTLDFFSREIDVLIIGKLLGAENLGLYSLSKQIVLRLFSLINPIVTSVLNPILSSIQDDKGKVKSLYLMVVNLLASCNFPIYLLVIVISKEILGILYGRDYISGYLVLSFLAISYAVSTISNPVGSLQIATGRTDLGFKWTVFRLLISPIAIYIAAQFSIVAVAATISIISIALLIPLWRIQIKPTINITLLEYFSQFSKTGLIMLSIVSIYIFSLEVYEFPFSLVGNALIKLVITSTLYLTLIWIIDKKSLVQFYSYFKSFIFNK